MSSAFQTNKVALLGVDVDGNEEKTLKEFLKFWSKACDHLISQSLFTLEDQKYVCWLDLTKQIEAGKKPLGGARYTNILVDEFQDVIPTALIADSRRIPGWPVS